MMGHLSIDLLKKTTNHKSQINLTLNKMKKTYEFFVSCSLVYDIEADSEEEARTLLEKGQTEKGSIVVSQNDYEHAELTNIN